MFEISITLIVTLIVAGIFIIILTAMGINCYNQKTSEEYKKSSGGSFTFLVLCLVAGILMVVIGIALIAFKVFMRVSPTGQLVSQIAPMAAQFAPMAAQYMPNPPTY